MELAEHGAKRGRMGQACLEMRPKRAGPDRFDKLVRIEQARERFHADLAATEEPLKKELHSLERRERSDRRAAVRRDQCQGPTAVCRPERELLSDHPAHRNANDVGPVPGKII
jgi:hypothetical protein